MSSRHIEGCEPDEIVVSILEEQDQGDEDGFQVIGSAGEESRGQWPEVDAGRHDGVIQPDLPLIRQLRPEFEEQAPQAVPHGPQILAITQHEEHLEQRDRRSARRTEGLQGQGDLLLVQET